jgi:hypothetical protein
VDKLSNEYKEKLKELSQLKYKHIDDIISKLSESQLVYTRKLEEAKQENNEPNALYLEGLVDGINLMLESLKKYNQY